MTPDLENSSSVSVIVPCYNAEKWIARAIQSVLDQDDSNVEIIVIDDGSADASLDVIKSFADRIHWESGPNRGACAARNRGLELSNADYVLFLDADDFLLPESLKHWVMAASSTGADVVFGPFDIEYEGKRVRGVPLTQPMTVPNIMRQWLEGTYVPPCSVLWRRSFVTAIGGWSANAPKDQDGEMTMRALMAGARVSIAEAGRGVYFFHDSPDRVSRSGGRAVVAWQLDSFKNLWEQAQARGYHEARSAFASAFYATAYEAFAGGFDDIGAAALKQARALGLKGHLGTVTHRIIASILGLRAKLRLTGSIKGRRRR